MQYFTSPVDLAGIRCLIQKLADQGIRVWLFGGWAEEVRGLTAPRAHKDVDLLYPGTDFSALDAFMRGTSGLPEVAVKRTPCSRAFEIEGNFVEFYLVQADEDGFFTDFWGYLHRWPRGHAGRRDGVPGRQRRESGRLAIRLATGGTGIRHLRGVTTLNCASVGL
jgi:hypothetical protein